jgi:hypothetical protein
VSARRRARVVNARVEANDKARAADYSISIKREFAENGPEAGAELALALVAHAAYRARQSERRRSHRKEGR